MPPLPDELLETNGTRPFERRQRRPLIGPAFNGDQQKVIAGLEFRIQQLERFLLGNLPTPAPQTPSEPAKDILPTETERVQTHEAETAADLANKAELKRLETATPGMIALLNEAKPEQRESLILIIEEDKPAQVRLAAMRKALTTP